MKQYETLEIIVHLFAANEVFTISESLEGVDNMLDDAWENGIR